MTELPPTLAGQVYLLAYDRTRERFTAHGHLGYVLRGALLAELRLRGNLAEPRDADGPSGKPEVNARVTPPADPVLAALLDEIARSRPRSWRHWVGRQGGRTRKAVLAELIAGRWVESRPRRLLGIIPVNHLVSLRPRAVTEVHARVAAALRESTPAARVDPWDVLLVALARTGDLSSAIPRATRRQHRHRIAALIGLSGPVPPAVRRTLQDHAAATSGGA